MAACALCKAERSLKRSHIIPQFVFDRIKRNSPTGFLRGGVSQVNLRRQDGDKTELLCSECEQRFSEAERNFAEKVFEPYHETGTTSFKYGPWLSYFISSVNWRTLHLDNIGFNSKKELLDEKLRLLKDAETILADFLLGERPDIAKMESHILPMFVITSGDSALEELNFYFRASVFDYTFCSHDVGGCYVCANLAGVLIFTVIQKGENDIWEHTFVEPQGGIIKQPPVRIRSPLMADMAGLLANCWKKDISSVQKDKILRALEANPNAAQAKAVHWRELDRTLRDERTI